MAKVCVEFDADGGTPGTTEVRTYTTTLGDGVTTDFTVVHSLGARDAFYTLRNVADNSVNDVDVVYTSLDANRVRLSFTAPPSPGGMQLTALAAVPHAV
jgi:hypothetical protein